MDSRIWRSDSLQQRNRARSDWCMAACRRVRNCDGLYGKVEVGQNIRTSLSQAVAEELCVPIDKVRLVMGDTQLTPFDMGTFGSRTTPIMNLQLRKVAAAARNLLIDLAAAQWQTDRAHLIAIDEKVTDPQENRSVEYVSLLKGKQLTQEVPADISLIPATDWRAWANLHPK